MRARPHHLRFAWAIALALLLAVRSLAPAGFMPAFDHGTVTIVPCPDAAPSMAMHHHGDHKRFHDPCPYAAASSLDATGPAWARLFEAILAFAAALLLGRTFLFVERQNRRDRPPAIGPPITA